MYSVVLLYTGMWLFKTFIPLKDHCTWYKVCVAWTFCLFLTWA